MTEERRLLYIHKLLHEEAKHRQEKLKALQKEQVASMERLLSALDIEEKFAAFCKRPDPDFLAPQPNTCPDPQEIEALTALEITALGFPCLRFADNGKTARVMYLADTKLGKKAIAATFLPWDGTWKLWKLNLAPTTDDLPAEPYARMYPDPKEMPPQPALGGPGGFGPPPGPGGPGGPGAPGGPGGEDAPPFDPDARSDVFSVDGDYARLSSDIRMLTDMALPDYTRACAEASVLMERCRRVVTPAYVTERCFRPLE